MTLGAVKDRSLAPARRLYAAGRTASVIAMPRRPVPGLLILALALACGPVDPDHGSAGSSGDASSAGATDAVTTGASQATTDAATESASSDAASTTSASDATTQATTDASATGGAHGCGEQSCGPAQVCVHPCCGGPAPGCTDVDGQGACANGQVPVPAEQCQFGGCTGQLCCPPVNCVPDPPFCAAATDLTCAGTSCSLESCFGTLDAAAADLFCECA